MRVAIFSNHKYDQDSFEEANGSFKHELVFLSATLDSATASLASGFPAVCAFVNDRLDAPVLAQLAKGGTKFVALRCAGYNNVDLGAAEAHGITVVRVPAYSPYAVAEFTVGVSLALDRQICRGWLRVREDNFSPRRPGRPGPARQDRRRDRHGADRLTRREGVQARVWL